MDKRIDFVSNKLKSPRFQLLFDRVQKMILKSFGVSSVYRPFPFKDRQNESILKGLLANNNPLYLMDKVIVPIFNSDLMIGIVELKDAHHLPKNQIEIIKNLVELPSFSSEASQKLNSLIKLEHNLMSNEIKNANNVIPFHPSSPSFLNPLPEKKFSLFSTKKLTDYSTLILANSYSNIEAMSQEIHYRSERYALLPFDDIDIRQSTPPELLELGSISLFVPEIKDLSEDQRNTLERVLRLPQDQEGPRLIIGSTFSLKELRKAHLLEDAYFKKMAIFRMSRDFHEYSKAELLQFFANKIRSKIFS